MMAQTARACSFLNRPWTLEDVISIPSDSDFGTDSDDEMMEHSVPRVNLVHDHLPVDSLSSISGIQASMVNRGGVSTENIGEHSQTKLQGTALADTNSESSTQELCVPKAPENSDPSASNPPTEMFFASSVPESPWSTADPDLLVCPAIQNHDNAVRPVLPAPAQGSSVISAASRYPSVQPAPILPSGDTVLHQQYADSSCQARLSSATNLIQSSNWCGQSHMINDDHGRIDGVALQSDDEMHWAVQPNLTKTFPLGCCPISPKGNSTEADQQHQAADDSLPLVPCLSPSPKRLGRAKGRQTSINAQHEVSRIDETCGKIAKPSSRRFGYRKAYNLRPLPVKRRLIGGENRDEGKERHTAHQKRRKVVLPQPRKRNSRQGESELSRSRKPRSSRKETMKACHNTSDADKGPAYSGVGSYEEWSLANMVLKCNRENGTAMFQLQFTSDTLWRALTYQNGPAVKDHQLPNKVKDKRHGTNKNQSNQRTKKIMPLQAAIPGVCPDIYRMSCLLARWRRHTFLVEWSDATTTWEPRKHIIDKGMLSEFEASWQGLDAGVDVLRTRVRAGKRQRLIHWHGRPTKEDTWVDDKLLSSNLMGR